MAGCERESSREIEDLDPVAIAAMATCLFSGLKEMRATGEQERNR